MKNNKIVVLILVVLLFVVIGIRSGGEIKEKVNEYFSTTEPSHVDMGYFTITQKQAKEMIDTESGIIILDVRTEAEREGGFIKNSILIPHTKIEEDAEDYLQNKDQVILVYCASGVRSKNAAEKLVKLGYKNIYEFGGIKDWEYEIVINNTQ